MTIELRPLGVNCNIACQYCYQHPLRDAGVRATGYDLAAMVAALDREDQPFALFGGEPLLVPIADLEDLFALGLRRHGRNTLQTNGALIDEGHIALFKAYRVSVGISFDGPGPLNDARWAGSLERTRAATERSERAIERLCAEEIDVSLIITLHRGNASPERLPALHEFVRRAAGLGVRGARLHVLEVESAAIRARYALSTAENLAALLSFARLERELPPGFLDVFSELEQLSRGRDDRASCVWRACDPYTTAAVSGIEGNGQRTNCGRTNKDGIDFAKADQAGYERSIALYHTPQEFGGCQGCRFWLLCKGQCPGTAIDGDWRNRTEHCELWTALFSHVESAMIAQGRPPISQHPERARIEQALLERWMAGHNPPLAAVMAQLDLPPLDQPESAL